MKFGELLESCKVGALASGYLRYEELAQKAEVGESGEDSDHECVDFADALVEELSRVSAFAADQLNKLRDDLAETDTLVRLCHGDEATRCLCGQQLPVNADLAHCHSCRFHQPDADGAALSLRGHAVLARESKMQMMSVYKQRLHNTYQRVFEFKQMCELNLQGFQKLIKKRNKAFRREAQRQRRRLSTSSTIRKESFSEPLLPETKDTLPPLTRDTLSAPEKGAGRPTNAPPNLGHAVALHVRQTSSATPTSDLPGASWVDMTYVRQQPFWAAHCKEAQDLARRIEEAFALHVTGGQIGRAQMKLRVFQREAMSQAALMEVGVYSGVAATLVFTNSILLGYPSNNQCPACVDVLHGMVPVFRLTLVPILWLTCWSCLCYFWRLHDINYLYILEIDAHTELGVWRALKLGMKLLAFWLLAVFLFLFGTQTGVLPLLGIDSRYYPLGFTVLCVIMIISPRGMFYFKTRKWLAVSLVRVVQAPAREVKLRENLVADVLTSMVKEMADMYYTWMLFSTGDFQHDNLRRFPDQFSRIGPMLIVIAPYWCRLFQCLRRYWDSCVASRVSGSPGGCWPSIGLLGMGDCLHLINAGKYFSSVCAISLAALGGFQHIVGPYVIWSPFRKIWFALLVVSALYAYVWDIIQDMGLVKLRRSQQTGRLQFSRRTTGAFSGNGLFLWLALSNFVGRMAWALTIVPRGRFSMEGIGIPACFMDSIVIVAEVLRRAQWTLLRVEHEHAENPNNYRSIAEVPSAITHREDGEEETHTSGEASAAISVVVVLAMFLVFSVLLYYSGVRVPGHGKSPHPPAWHGR